jgi:uncharacterized protein
LDVGTALDVLSRKLPTTIKRKIDLSFDTTPPRTIGTGLFAADAKCRPLSDLFQAILTRYPLQPCGTHGVSHWGRVWETGEALAHQTGANMAVVRLFALFHDCQRENEGWDDGHGQRGADLAAEFRDVHYDVADDEFDMLQEACTRHTDGLTCADMTVMTCWDADRLDLGRVGIVPARARLCTEAARDGEFLNWANERAQARYFPAWIKDLI